MKSLLMTALAVLSLLAFIPANALAQAEEGNNKTIAQIAMETPDLSTLVAAVKAAGLADALMADGKMTVFAPTNAAFNKLPAGVVDALLMPSNKDALVGILKYHVSGDYLPAKDVVAGIQGATDNMLSAKSMGGNFSVMQKDGKVMIKDGKGNMSNVMTTDIMASNGVVHLIDAVLLPENLDVAALTAMKKMDGEMMTDRMNDKKEEMKDGMKRDGMTARNSATSYRAAADGPTIVDVAAGNDNFRTLTAAVTAAELDGVLGSSGEFTVFAPTEEAFGALPDGTVEDLTRAENKQKLQGILQYHVIPSRISAADLTAAITNARGYYRLQTIDGQSLIATTKDGKVMLTDGNGNMATVIMTDVNGSNGVVHAIDGVLMPRTGNM